MEDPQKREPLYRKHQTNEVANEFACQRLIRQWTEGRDIPSSQAIKLIHKQLMKGIESYHQKGITPISPGDYRKSDIRVTGEPDNFFVSGIDVESTMSLYAKDLDLVLHALPRHPLGNIDEVVRKAAWAYYVFERIHPFLDGNGRVGRMILKRVICAAGLKDLVFHSSEGWDSGRESHLDALNAVDRSNNLDHLELYILRQLEPRYSAAGEKGYVAEIRENIGRRERNITSQKKPYKLIDIWKGFEGKFIEDFQSAAAK
jgi:Fic family protein